MPGPIFVTGGSGFVGAAVIEELLSREYGVRALVNRHPLSIDNSRVESVAGGLFNPQLAEQMSGCSAVIHLVGIIMEKPAAQVTFERIHFQGTQAVVDAARRAGIKRYLHMSALGVRADAKARYHKTKFMAEEYVRASGLDWTIFRPSLIHGLGGEFMQMEARWARHRAPPFLFMPYFGAGLMGLGGAGRLQPIYVEDLARAFVDAMEKPNTVCEVYPLGGPDVITWPQLHRTVALAVVGKKRWVMAIPAWKARLLTRIVPRPLLPFNRDQVIMSQEDNTCDITKFTDDFGWQPRGFETTMAEYARIL